jgi:anti-sigma factor RsiW
MEKSCKEIEEMLVDYADGQLSAGDSNEVAKHLAGCESCRKLLNALRNSLELAGVIWSDGLTEAQNIRIPTSGKARKVRWLRYAAVAAGILLALSALLARRTLVKPAEVQKKPNFAQIERQIEDEGTAARLLAATELVAVNPDTKELIKSQYEYIVTYYPNTDAAKTAKMKIE